MLGFKAVSIRTSTERPEAIDHGNIILGGITIQNIINSIEITLGLNDKIYPRYLSVDFDLMCHDKKRCHDVIKKLMSKDYKLIKKTGEDMTFIQCRT
jgi:UDP-N-acetylglucosamine 2-epimerase